jgi:hypothetical protein
MSYARLVLPAAVLVLAGVSGCGSARMIQSGPDGGVVSIPSNSNSWPCRYRESAEKLMAQKCPNGYEIVREEEVVVGQRSTTAAQTITPAGYKDGSPTATAVVTSSHAETEYRITFRSRQPVPTTPVPTVSPVLMPVPSQVPPPAPPGLPPRPIPVGM